jgi:transposase
MTTLLPPGVKVHLALGYVDMRKGIDGLAMLVQGVLRQDPFLCLGRDYVAQAA